MQLKEHQSNLQNAQMSLILSSPLHQHLPAQMLVLCQVVSMKQWEEEGYESKIKMQPTRTRFINA